MDWPEVELYLWTYLCCMWVAFGLYAAGHETWKFREAVGKVLHSSNSGMLAAWAGSQAIGTVPPWPILAIACATSMGWAKKEDIIKAVLKTLSNGNGKHSKP